MKENLILNKKFLENYSFDEFRENLVNSIKVRQLIWDFSFKSAKKYEKVIVADWFFFKKKSILL